MAHNSEMNGNNVPAGIVGALADAFKKHPNTIYRWIKDNDDRLTSDRAKQVFKEHGYEYVPREDSESKILEAATK